MNRYFFILCDGEREPDDIGTLLPDDESARLEALRFLGEVLMTEPDKAATGQLIVEVRDPAGAMLFRIDAAFTDTRPHGGDA